MANTTDTWIGGSGDWDDAANWSDGVPGIGADVVIDTAVTVTLDVDTADLDSLKIKDSGATLDVGAYTLNVTGSPSGEAVDVSKGALTMEGGTINVPNSVVRIETGASFTGYGTIDGGLSGGGTDTVTAGQSLTVTGAVDGVAGETRSQITLGAGSTLTLNGAVGTNSVTTQFNLDAGAKLDLAGGLGGFHGIIESFDKTNGSDIQVAGAESTAFDASTGVLDVYSSTMQSMGTLIGTIDFAKSGDSSDMFVVRPGGNIDAYCFMAGTRIATPAGERAVEDLAVGDLVVTADGRQAPVRWMGRQTVSTVFSDPLRVTPIRVRAGALGENAPSRDLLLSPDHALLVDGVLIQAGALVNGVSIVRDDEARETFVYHHVELDDHALVLAEGVPAETFIDNVQRLAFDNWAEHEALYPQGKAIGEMALPRAKAHRQVPRTVRERLISRAAALYGEALSTAA